MAAKHITVTELKCACLDPEWRRIWLEGKKPSTKSLAPPGELPAYGTLFHQIVDAFVGWLTTTRSKKATSLLERDVLWNKMHDRFAANKLDRLFKDKKIDSGYHLTQALKAFCQRVADLRNRTPDFRSWKDVYLAKEFAVKNIRFDFGNSSLFVSGQLDAVRFHPVYELEVVDYKLTHGSQMKHDLLQLSIYAKLLSIAKPRLKFHGTLEYYEPELHEVPVSPEDLDSLFNDAVLPILHEIATEKVSALSRPRRVKKRFPEKLAKSEAKDLSSAIQECYASFNLDVEVLDRHEAPQLVRYRVKPAPGVKVVSLANRADDLRVALSLPQPPMIEPAKGSVVMDIPKETVDTVYWHAVVKDPTYAGHDSPVSFPIGVGVDNQVIIADFADPNMCHCLVAGVAGSGKSEFLKCLVASLIAKNKPETLKLTIIDPKILTFGGLSTDLPHLTAPVITDVNAAIPCLREAIEEMESRYQILFKESFENLSERFKSGKKDIYYYVIVFDEFADLILAGKEEKKEFESLVSRLAQMGRAAGIHLVLTTQRPDRTVLTGLVKANLPLKVCMRVTNSMNSTIILDQTGGEKLLGRGDLLCDRGRGIQRAQSPYITQDELRNLANAK